MKTTDIEDIISLLRDNSCASLTSQECNEQRQEAADIIEELSSALDMVPDPMPDPLIAILPLHGMKGPCPTCHSKGTFDTRPHPDNPKYTSYEDAITWHSKGQHWECYDCWLK